MKITVIPNPIDHEQGIEVLTEAGIMSKATLLGYKYYDDKDDEVFEDNPFDNPCVDSVLIFLETDLSKEMIAEMIEKVNDDEIIQSVFVTDNYGIEIYKI